MDEHGTSLLPLPVHIEERLQHLASLERNWDGEGAKPPAMRALAVVRAELNRLAEVAAWAVDDVFVVPAIDGSIRLEWVADSGRELTVTFPPNRPDAVEIYRYCPEPLLEEHDTATDVSRLPELLRWLRTS